MIGHQAPSPDRHVRPVAPEAQQLGIKRKIGLGKESLLATIAALGDVVGYPGNNETRGPRHDLPLRQKR